MNYLFTNPFIIQAMVFISISSVLWIMLRFLRVADPRVEARLGAFQSGDQKYQIRKSKIDILQQVLDVAQITQLAKHLVPDNERARSLIQTKLLYAGIYSQKALVLFFSARLAAMVIPPLFCWALVPTGLWGLEHGLLYGSFLGAFGFLIPGFWLNQKIANRHSILRSSLPNFLDLLLACVDSGLGLHSSIRHITDELKYANPELSSEFSVCLQQMELGTSLEDAIADLAQRTGLDELRSLKTFIQQTQKYGSSMGGALRELADTLRYQREIRAEELAQKAAVKIMIPTLLFIFPAVFVVLAGPAAIRIQQNMKAMTPTAGGSTQSESSSK